MEQTSYGEQLLTAIHRLLYYQTGKHERAVRRVELETKYLFLFYS
jgi:hypothetical protein